MLNLLKKDLSLVIIIFYLLEDLIIKKFFGNLIKSKYFLKMFIKEEKKYIVKVYSFLKVEISENNRLRSVKLRVLIKLI